MGNDRAEYMDQLYREAVAAVVEAQTPSTSFIQRKLQISYDTAAKLMIRMQRDQVCSEPNYAGRRTMFRSASPKQDGTSTIEESGGDHGR